MSADWPERMRKLAEVREESANAAEHPQNRGTPSP